MLKDIESVPKLSIVIPSYQDSVELQRCLESIVRADLGHVQVIVQDGALSEETARVCRTFSSDLELIYVAQPDSGIYEAIDFALEKVTADFVMILGSDDRVLHDLATFMPLFPNPNTIYYGSVLLKHAQKIYDGEFTTEKLFLKNICQQAIVYPKSVISQLKLYSASPLFADYLLNIHFWTNSAYSWKFIDKTIVEFNERGLSGQKKDDYFYKNHSQIKQVLLKKEDFSLLKVLFLKSVNSLNMWMNSITRKGV